MQNEKPKPTKRAKLTVAQLETVGQFSDHSFENRKLSFEETVQKVKVKFSPTPQGRLFRRKCKAVFDLERR